MIPLLHAPDDFPDIDAALEEPNGLLAAGGRLTPAWLLTAYRRGIFPWFGEGDPILWWSPSPRMVLFPAEVRLRRALAKRLRHAGFEMRLDSAFEAVIAACAQPRAGQPGTWITAAMQRAYGELHRLGHAHSVETWQAGQLVGGLYGLALGKVFFGESMFSRVADASKAALVCLCAELRARGFVVIDCQMNTPHLASMGAHEIPRARFRALLEHCRDEAPPGPWRWQAPPIDSALAHAR